MPSAFTSRARMLLGIAVLTLALSLYGAATGHARPETPRGDLGSAPPGADGTKKWEAQSWMGDLFSSGTVLLRPSARPVPAPSVTLGRLAIPGSHDSAAYQTHGWADECEDHFFLKKWFGTNTARRWARTQHYDLYTQARLGVRSFDIRPYYNGRELRTCHGLDTGGLWEAFDGDSGLNRFVKEQPKEVIIINLSHFRPTGSDDPRKYANGIAAISSFLRGRVCPKAIDPGVVPGEKPGAVSLGEMWRRGKNYVVLANNEEAFYKELVREGLGNCVFNTEVGVSGGYAHERDSVSYGENNDRRSSTNLWRGMLDDECYLYHPACRYGPNGREFADGVRDATEKSLVEQFGERHKSLDEVSYIWVYGTFAGVDNADVALYVSQLDDATLITATEDRRWKLDSSIFHSDTVINGGLLPYARRFIERLNGISKRSECFASVVPCYTTVNIVNMDAIGNNRLTREGFIDPLMELNQSFIQ